MVTDQWVVGVDAAMICDEWYTDFNVGQVIDFPVVFYSPRPRKYSTPRLDRAHLEPSDDNAVRAEVIDGFDYMINGQTIYAGDAGWVLDIGIRVAARSKATEPGQAADWTEVGKFVRGRTFLLAEWAETGALQKDLAAPPLVYTWRVDRIQMWDEQVGEHTNEQNTNAWMEMRLDRHPSYQLTCTRLDVEPRRITTKLEKLIERNMLLRKKRGIDT